MTLEDPKNMIPAQQVLPIINTKRVPEDAQAVLNRISAVLTTDDLRSLNDEVSGDKKLDPSTAAANWLKDKGLLQPFFHFCAGCWIPLGSGAQRISGWGDERRGL